MEYLHKLLVLYMMFKHEAPARDQTCNRNCVPWAFNHLKPQVRIRADPRRTNRRRPLTWSVWLTLGGETWSSLADGFQNTLCCLFCGTWRHHEEVWGYVTVSGLCFPSAPGVTCDSHLFTLDGVSSVSNNLCCCSIFQSIQLNSVSRCFGCLLGALVFVRHAARVSCTTKADFWVYLALVAVATWSFGWDVIDAAEGSQTRSFSLIRFL